MKKTHWKATLVMGGARIDSEHATKPTDAEVLTHHKMTGSRAPRPSSYTVEYIPFEKEVDEVVAPQVAAPAELPPPKEATLAATIKLHFNDIGTALDATGTSDEDLEFLSRWSASLLHVVSEEKAKRLSSSRTIGELGQVVGCDVRNMTVTDLVKLLGPKGLKLVTKEDSSG